MGQAARTGKDTALHPFQTSAYLAGLATLGTPCKDRDGVIRVLRRQIPGSPLADGVGPWPYLWITGAADLAALQDQHPELVTITAVTQPGYVPPRQGVDSVFLKDHFIYDPRLPKPQLSARATLRLRRAMAISTVEIAQDPAAKGRLAAAMIRLYRAQALRRGFSGFFHSLPDRHFTALAEMPAGRFFCVTIEGAPAAMACAATHEDQIQILHIALSDHGLRQNASYVLMQALQDYAEATGTRLLTGGMPEGARPSLGTFKQRWANSTAPVHLLRIVNDPARYRTLSGDAETEGFFPAYRRRRLDWTAGA